jgi:hypothetical protein
MVQKIAKKSLLIFLLFSLIVSSILAPMKASIVNAAPSNETVATETTEEDTGVMNKCPTCFVAVDPGRWTGWRWLTGAIDTFLSLIPRIMVFISKWIVILLANILNNLMAPGEGTYFFNLNRFLDKNGIVFWIWKTALTYANILITLFLIWIAINIILEKKEYTSYQSLVKLVVAAILVNFSLVICTLFVDISNYLSWLFMSNVSTSSFSCLYACTIHKVANMFNCVATEMVFSETISNTVALVVALIFVGQLLGLIIYVLLRMVYLWFLVGVSPVAFVLATIPETRSIFGKWKSMFTTYLIQLPIIAFASYFILNLMIYLSNTIMTSNAPYQQGSGGSNFLAFTLATVFLIIILAQALLAVAQAINIKQVAMMSEKVNSWAKKGWDAVRKPAMSYTSKKILSAKPVQSAIERGRKSSWNILADTSNVLRRKMESDQGVTASNINKWVENKNIGLIEKALRRNSGPRTGDPAIFQESMAALAKLESQGDYKGDLHKQQKYMSRIKDIMSYDTFADSEAGSFLKGRYNWIKSGPDWSKQEQKDHYAEKADSLVPKGIKHRGSAVKNKAEELAYYMPFQNTGKSVNGVPDLDRTIHAKMMRGLYERATKGDARKKNDWMTDFQRLYDASKQNKPEAFLEVFKSFLRTFSADDMKSIFHNVHESLRGKFWSNIAKMAIVAEKVEKNDMGDKTIEDWFKHFDSNPGEITSNAREAFINLADGDSETEKTNNSWMSDKGKKSFVKALEANEFIDKIK